MFFFSKYTLKVTFLLSPLINSDANVSQTLQRHVEGGGGVDFGVGSQMFYRLKTKSLEASAWLCWETGRVIPEPIDACGRHASVTLICAGRCGSCPSHAEPTQSKCTKLKSRTLNVLLPSTAVSLNIFHPWSNPENEEGLIIDVIINVSFMIIQSDQQSF